MNDSKIVCNECGSSDLRKTGFGVRQRQKVQRYQCKKCLKVFIPKSKSEV